MRDRLYHYEATVDRVVDGDSVYLYIDLGFRTHHHANCRLYGIDAPEIYRPESEEEREAGEASKTFLENQLNQADEIVVRSEELDKYGRPLATIYARLGDEWANINRRMLEEGYAERYEG